MTYTEGAAFTVSCHVVAVGKWPPLLEWQSSTQTLNETDVETDIKGNRTTATVYYAVSEDDNGGILTCSAHYPEPPEEDILDEHHAVNAPDWPDYIFDYCDVILNVLCKK